MRRVAAIAIDALDRAYLDRQLAAGALPNLARLRDRAATARLATKLPYRSELVWARFLTGREPLDDRDWPVCITFDPQSYDIGLNTASTRPPFYALGPGTRVVALDLIHSSTAEGVDGVQVVGWGAHSPQWPRSSRPVGLLTEIDRRFGTNPAFGNDFDYGWHDAAFLDALTEASETGAGRRVDIADWLLRQHPDWQLFLTCISEFHSVGHQMWHGVDERHPLHGVAPTSDQAARQVGRVTKAVDGAVGRILDAVGPDTTVVLFAMHGFDPADDLASTVLMPELFQRLHLHERLLRDPDTDRWRRAGCPPVIPAPDEHIGTALGHAFADGPRQRALRAAKQALPSTAFDWLRRAAGRPLPAPLRAMANPIPEECAEITAADLAASSVPPVYEPAFWYRRHWRRMPWFALPSFADGHVRVNLRGRERDGVVDKEDYGRVLDRIERELRACRDARTGEPVVEECLRMQEADPMDPVGPDADLLVLWRGAPDALEHPSVGVVGPFPHLRASHHNAAGFAYVAGPGIAPRDLGERPSEDLTPTILSLLGQATPTSVRGRPLVERP